MRAPEFVGATEKLDTFLIRLWAFIYVHVFALYLSYWIIGHPDNLLR